MTQTEDYTPSLLAGLVRYRRQVALVVVGFAVIGAVYVWSAWKPQSTMTVVVQVSDSTGNSSANPDRTTNEVAASLSSPEVTSAAEDASGVSIESIATSWSQGQSTVGVLLTAGSPAQALAAADALLPAYNQVRDARSAATLAQQVTAIDASLATVDEALAANISSLNGLPAASAEAQRLQAEGDALVSQRTQLQSDRNAAQVAAASPTATVSIASGPDGGPGRLSLLTRYVPAAVVLGLLLCMAAVAVIERRRPWLAEPETASGLLRAPLLGVGPGPTAGAGTGGTDAVAPLAAMSILRAVGDTPTGIALLVSCGGPSIGLSTISLARDMTPVFERAGAKVALLTVATSGRAFLFDADGLEKEIDGLWSDFSGKEEFVRTLSDRGIQADLVVMVPDTDIEHAILLDLVLLADVSVVATRTGTLLEPLFSLRRDFDALGCEPHGVVADLPLR